MSGSNIPQLVARGATVGGTRPSSCCASCRPQLATGRPSPPLAGFQPWWFCCMAQQSNRPRLQQFYGCWRWTSSPDRPLSKRKRSPADQSRQGGNSRAAGIARGTLSNLCAGISEPTVKLVCIPVLVGCLRFGDATQKEEALRQLLTYSCNKSYKVAIAEAGAEPLRSLARDGTTTQKAMIVDLLDNLSLMEQIGELRGQENAVTPDRDIAPLISMAWHGNDIQKDAALSKLLTLSMDAMKRSSIAKAGGIEVLTALLQSVNHLLKKTTGMVLWNLTLHDFNKKLVETAGGIPVLVELLSDSNNALGEVAAAVLSNLSMIADNQASIAEAGGIPPLIILVRRGNVAQKEYAAAALWHLSASPHNRESIAEAHGVPPLITLLESRNNAHSKCAAGALRKFVTKQPR